MRHRVYARLVLFRLLAPRSGQDSRMGTLDGPVIGSFHNGRAMQENATSEARAEDRTGEATPSVPAPAS